MSNDRQKTILWAIIISESSHVFCCVLPTVLSAISLLTVGLGGASFIPQFIWDAHDVLHHYELPMIGFSAFILAMGWGLHIYSQKIDCHDTGCGHGPCEPTKNKTHWLLIGATALFTVNVLVYAFIHRNPAFDTGPHHHHEHVHEHEDHAHEHE